MADTKTIEQHERERNLMARDRKKYPADKKLTDDEFTEIFTGDINNFVGVNHEDRIEFLKTNGYPVTHENMIDSELSAQLPE